MEINLGTIKALRYHLMNTISFQFATALGDTFSQMKNYEYTKNSIQYVQRQAVPVLGTNFTQCLLFPPTMSPN